MRKFLLKICFFVGIIILVDQLFGQVMSRIDNIVDIKGGCKYIFDKVESDVLVFGSSRAYRHYDTNVLYDSLKIPCYNCGQSAQGFIHNYALLKELTKRYCPLLIIYDLNPKVDFVESDRYVYISNLRPYIDREPVKEVVCSVNPLEKYKSLSSLYRYNSICNSLIIECLFGTNNISINGFVPTHQEMDKTKLKKDIVKTKVDTLKMYFAGKFVETIKEMSNTKLIFVISPRWYGMSSSYVNMAKTFASKHDIPLYDFSNDLYFVHNDSLFYDGSHLNARGAYIFTKALAGVLRENNIEMMSTLQKQCK